MKVLGSKFNKSGLFSPQKLVSFKYNSFIDLLNFSFLENSISDSLSNSFLLSASNLIPQFLDFINFPSACSEYLLRLHLTKNKFCKKHFFFLYNFSNLLNKFFGIPISRIVQYEDKELGEIMELEAAQGNQKAQDYKKILSDPDKILEIFRLTNLENKYIILQNIVIPRE